MEIPKEEFLERIENVRMKMKEEKYDVLIAYSGNRDYNPGNSMYLANYYGIIEEQTMVVVTASDAVLLSDQVWTEAKMKCVSPIPCRSTTSPENVIAELLHASNVQRGKMGIAGWNIFPARLYLEIKKDFPELEIEGTDILMELRMVKSKNEISMMRKASRITDMAFEKAMNTVKVGRTEREVIAAAEHVIRLSGAEPSWQHEVGSGVQRTILLGPNPSEKKLRKGELVMVDMGATYKGYHGDVTRMKPIGRIAEDFEDALELELESLKKAISVIRPGVRPREVHEAGRIPIEEAGYNYMGTGHGNGLDEHEWPWLGEWHGTKTDVKLASGMVLCVEPIFITPELGCIHLEDMVLVTQSSHEVLTKVPKVFW